MIRQKSQYLEISLWSGKIRTGVVYFLSAEACQGAYVIKLNAPFAHYKIQLPHLYAGKCPKNYKENAKLN